jgi:hypothetical protein
MRIRKMSLLLLLLLLLLLCLCMSWEIPIFQLIIFGIYIRSVYLLLTLSTCKFFAGDPHGKFGARAPFFCSGYKGKIRESIYDIYFVLVACAAARQNTRRTSAAAAASFLAAPLSYLWSCKETFFFFYFLPS